MFHFGRFDAPQSNNLTVGFECVPAYDADSHVLQAVAGNIVRPGTIRILSEGREGQQASRDGYNSQLHMISLA
jgi:hypothetical protein